MELPLVSEESLIGGWNSAGENQKGCGCGEKEGKKKVFLLHPGFKGRRSVATGIT